MKHLLIVFVILVFQNITYAAIDDNIDYDFINNVFSNPNPTTNKDFEKVMQEYEAPKKEGFLKRMYKFFDSDKVKYDTAFKTKYENSSNQPARLKNVQNDMPTIMISANSEDSSGNFVQTGYYQVKHKKNDDGTYRLELYQGSNNLIATLVAHQIKEDEKSTTIMYARSESTNNGFIKVFYGNLDVTLLGYLKIKEESDMALEPVYTF